MLPIPEVLAAALRFSRRSTVLAPLLGVLLALPALGRQRVLDDHVLELLARGGGGAVTERAGFDLFQFASGDTADNLALMAQGSMLPWWSDPALKITFFRPLSSLLHRLDFAAWPERSELMYAHTLLWFGLLLALVARLYARLEQRPGVATLAACLYAINDAHGPVVAWLSNRNALASGVGAMAALLAHHHARRERHGPSQLWASLWLALGLFAGELGLSAWAFFAAYALAFESGPLARRLASLWPFAIVTLAWACVYVASGAGTHASGLYLHPLHDLSGFAEAFPERALVLLGAAFGPFPAELSLLGAAGLVPVWVAVALALMGALAWVNKSELSSDPVMSFWWIATLLAVIPVAASFPSDRLLVLVNVGAMAIVSRTLFSLWHHRSRARLGAYALGGSLLAVHGPLAARLLPWRAHHMQQLGRATERAFACLDAVPDLEHKTLVVLGAPADFFVGYLQAGRAARGLARPEHVYWLSNPDSALEVRATGDRTLSFTREGGFFTTVSESLYRKPSAQLALNASVLLPELTARVSDVAPSGTPTRIEFSFAEPLTAERFVFVALRGAAYERVEPRELAQLHVLAAMPLPELLSSSSDYSSTRK